MRDSTAVVITLLSFSFGCGIGGCTADMSYQRRLVEDGYAEYYKNGGDFGDGDSFIMKECKHAKTKDN